MGLFWASVALCTLITVFVLDNMGYFDSEKPFNVDGKTVVVTGGSQGMGRGLAKLLAQKGANVVIVARNESKLAEAFQYIAAAAKDSSRQRFNAISADVTKPGENDRIIAEVTKWNHGQPPDIVWANAGSAHPGLFLETDVSIMRSQMDLNYFAAADLAQSTLRAWTKTTPTPSSGVDSKSKPSDEESKEANARHFIMTSSVAAYIGLAGYGAYAPAKAALRSLCDTLRNEVQIYNGMRRSGDVEMRSKAPDRDIAVHLIIPGTIKSPGYDHEETLKHAVTKMLEKGDPAQTEDEVAAAAIKGLERGGYIVSTQYLGHLIRASMLGFGPRNSALIDTVLSWIMALVVMFVGPDFESKVRGYGRRHGTANVSE